MSSDSLTQWRLSWTHEELSWRPLNWAEHRENRALERERRRQERARQDRKTFGQNQFGISSEHRRVVLNHHKITKSDLPLIDSEQDLANWLTLSLHELRWFTFDRSADTVYHYFRYTIPKRSGGQRVILAPKPELKRVQRQILHEILNKVPLHPAAHGFAMDHSIVTNAYPHIGHRFVLNLDMKDFFPGITAARVRGIFVNLGYSFPVAAGLALLCTEYDRIPYTRHGLTYYVSKGERHLVQGAPSSPALANLAARSLDKRLSEYSSQLGIIYTRYADDLTFSGDNLDALHKMRRAAYHIIEYEGFRVNHQKTRLMTQATRQMVTGVVVNQHTSTPRELRRQVRAIIHNAQRTGLQAQNRDGRENFRAYLQGLIGYIHEANPSHALPLSRLLQSIPD